MEIREPVVVYDKKRLTVQEYLQFEKESAEKHEFYRGEVFVMAEPDRVITKFSLTFS